ncbi:MAG: DUF2510 domain-containing protein [Friedmanniella sp.]
MSAAPRPGWYPDPAGTPELYRWWDGADWTQAISESPRAPTPRLHSPAGPEDELVRRRPSRLRSVVALLLCLALFLGATVGLGLAIWQDTPTVQRSGRLPVAGTVAPPSTPAAGALGRLDQKTRVATIGNASMTLPDQPYLLSPNPLQTTGLDVFFLASAPVHPGFDGWRSWSAVVLLARLTPGEPGKDLAAQAQEGVRQLSRTLFRDHRTRVESVLVTDHSVDGNAGLMVTAEVHYDIDHLASRYDRVAAVLVQLDDGSVVAAVSSVPDDSGDLVTLGAEQALDSLTLG